MSFRPAGSQAEAHGRTAAISCHRSGDASSDPDADTAVGGESGAAPLRAVPAALLHGLAAKWRAAQSEGELWPQKATTAVDQCPQIQAVREISQMQLMAEALPAGGFIIHPERAH